MLIFLRQYRRVYSNRLLSALLLMPLTCFSAYGQGASGDTTRSPSFVPTPGAQETQPIAQGWVKLTHKVGNEPKSVFIQVAQICLVGQSVDAEEGYHTLIQLANGKETYVSEPVLMVMKLVAEASKAK